MDHAGPSDTHVYSADTVFVKTIILCMFVHSLIHALTHSLTHSLPPLYILQGFTPPLLVFVQSKERAKELFHELIYDGLNVEVIHADRTQAQRDNIIKSFRAGKVSYRGRVREGGSEREGQRGRVRAR